MWFKKKEESKTNAFTTEHPKSDLIIQLEQTLRDIGAYPSYPTSSAVTAAILVMKNIITVEEAIEIERHTRQVMSK